MQTLGIFHSRRHTQPGFTLIELLMVLAVLGCVGLLATPSLQALLERGRAELARDQLHSDLQSARVRALQLGQALRLARLSDCAWASAAGSDWSCGWQLQLADGSQTLQVTPLHTPLWVSYTKSSALTISRQGDLGGVGDRWTVGSRNPSLSVACAVPQQHRAHPRGLGGHMQLKRTRHDGVALLEALMALLLLTCGVLASLWLQQIGLHTQRQQVNRSIAMGLAEDLAERMRLNPSQAALYTRSWGTASRSTAPDCTALACTRSDLALWDMAQLQQALSAQLPQGDAAVLALSGQSGWWGVVVAWHDSGETYRTDTAWGSPACPSAMSCWRLLFRPSW